MSVLLSGTMGESSKPSVARRLARSGAALALGFAASACGRVAGSDRGAPTPSEGSSGSDGMGTANGPGEMPAPVLQCIPGRLPRRAVWLSELQFARAITQLLGPAALDAEQLPDVTLKRLSQNDVVVDRSLLQKRLDRAGRASASLEGRVAEVTGCAASDDGCGEPGFQRLRGAPPRGVRDRSRGPRDQGCEFGALRELPPSETSLRQIVAGLASSALLRTRAGE